MVELGAESLMLVLERPGCPRSSHRGRDIAFLESARLDDVLLATASEVALRGRSGIYDVQVAREVDGVVVAEFRGRSRSVALPTTSG